MKRVSEAPIDWDDMQCFLAICRHGSLSAAAKALGVTQPTMGRRLNRLHERVATTLLVRGSNGYELTDAGEAARLHVERMEEEALAVSRQLSGVDLSLAGEVRIATVEAFAANILAPRLGALIEQYPNLSIEVDVDTRSLSLGRREADIALRMAPFQHHDVVVRKAGRMAFGLYASHDYLVRFGNPLDSDIAGPHRVIALQKTLDDAPESRWLRELLPRATNAVTTNSREGQLAACVGGVGVACLPRYLADPRSELQLLQPRTPPPVRDLWAGVHRDLRSSAKIRAVLEWMRKTIDESEFRLNPKLETNTLA